MFRFVSNFHLILMRTDTILLLVRCCCYHGDSQWTRSDCDCNYMGSVLPAMNWMSHFSFLQQKTTFFHMECPCLLPLNQFHSAYSMMEIVNNTFDDALSDKIFRISDVVFIICFGPQTFSN